jgi:hypothetical protein
MGILIDNIKASAILQRENQYHKVFNVMLHYEYDEDNVMVLILI